VLCSDSILLRMGMLRAAMHDAGCRERRRQQKQTHHRQSRPPCCCGRLLRIPSRLLSLGGCMSGKWRLPRAERAQANHRAPLPVPKGHRGGIEELQQQHSHAIAHHILMSSPLLDVWEAAAGSPYYPAVGKNTQFTVGFTLLLFCMRPRFWSYRGALLMTRSSRPRHPLRPQYARPLSYALRLRTHKHNRPFVRQSSAARRPSFRGFRVRVQNCPWRARLTDAVLAPST
jgi:hypothetical protein